MKQDFGKFDDVFKIQDQNKFDKLIKDNYIASENEIMILCKVAFYIDRDFYNQVFPVSAKILGSK